MVGVGVVYTHWSQTSHADSVNSSICLAAGPLHNAALCWSS